MRLDVKWARWVLAGAACLVCSCSRGAPPSVTLATTTSVANSGLLERLLPSYTADTGVAVHAAPVGSGRALRMLADRLAGVAITHAPAQETDAIAVHRDWRYEKFLFNDFVILGPPDDPAHAGAAGSAVDAMRAIAASGARFISRGDESGTHERERLLWAAAGAKPASGHFVIAGAGMGDTLRVADQTQSYTLSDEGTYLQLAPRLTLRVVSRPDPRLVNTYAVIAPLADAEGMRFEHWLASGEGWTRLNALVTSGQVTGFKLWPLGRPRSAPADLP